MVRREGRRGGGWQDKHTLENSTRGEVKGGGKKSLPFPPQENAAREANARPPARGTVHVTRNHMTTRDVNTLCGLADLFLRGYILESDIRPDGSVREDVRQEAVRRFLGTEDHIHRHGHAEQVARRVRPMFPRPASASAAHDDTTVSARANELLRRRRAVPLPLAESETASRPPDASSKPDDTVTMDDSLLNMTLKTSPCVVCMSSKRSYACTPCGHLALCSRCQLRVQDVCPICRAQDVTMVQIFWS